MSFKEHFTILFYFLSNEHFLKSYFVNLIIKKLIIIPIKIIEIIEKLEIIENIIEIIEKLAHNKL